MKRNAAAVWEGGSKTGKGTMSKEGCPVSTVLNAKITLNATLRDG